MVARVEDRGGSSGCILRSLLARLPVARLVARVVRRLFSLVEVLPWDVGLRGVALSVVMALAGVAADPDPEGITCLGARGINACGLLCASHAKEAMRVSMRISIYPSVGIVRGLCISCRAHAAHYPTLHLMRLGCFEWLH